MDNNVIEKKKVRVEQSDIPQASLKSALELAKSLKEDFAGSDTNPLNLAKAIGRSPSSSTWRSITGAAVAYGLTNGGYGAKSISLTALGKQIVSPTEPGLEGVGLKTSALRPRILKEFYEKYNKNKFPSDEIAKNVLEEMGVPSKRTNEALKIIKDNARLVGILTDISGSQYIQLENPNTPSDTDLEGGNSGEMHNSSNSIPYIEQKKELRLGTKELSSIPVIRGKLELMVSVDLEEIVLYDEEVSSAVKQLRGAVQKYIEKEEQKGKDG